MGLLYRKVGRLYPGHDDGQVHVIVDDSEEFNVISKELLLDILAGDTGERDPGLWHTINIPAKEGTELLALVSQVKNMLEKWPKRKAALWALND